MQARFQDTGDFQLLKGGRIVGSTFCPPFITSDTDKNWLSVGNPPVVFLHSFYGQSVFDEDPTRNKPILGFFLLKLGAGNVGKGILHYLLCDFVRLFDFRRLSEPGLELVCFLLATFEANVALVLDLCGPSGGVSWFDD
jgi:hypothetical protein